MISRLVYASNALRFIKKDDLKQIFESSSNLNSVLDITGYLYFNDRRFFQYLEGPEINVKSLYDKIARDERHDVQIYFYLEPKEERLYPNWSMNVFSRREGHDFGVDRELNRLLISFQKKSEISDKDREAVEALCRRISSAYAHLAITAG